MYDTYIMKRTQIYLDPEQAAALSDRAGQIGTTSSSLIREAVAEYLTAADRDDDAIVLAGQRAALDAAFGTMPRWPDAETCLADGRRGEVERQTMLDQHRGAADTPIGDGD